jgi:hypothetical protein
MLLKWTLVILHIITAAAWFGLGLRLAGQARTVLNLKGDAQAALADDGQQSVRLMTLFILLTLVFSIGAFIAGGHFNTYGPAYHSALTLIVLLTLDQLVVIRPAWGTLQSFATPAGDENVSADDAESAKTRVAIGTGVGHLIWLVLLGLMFTNQIVAAI